MKASSFEGVPVSELVSKFRDAALAQFETRFEDGGVDKYNRLYDELNDIEAELRRRPGDQRQALTSLYTHENAEVRLKAAFATHMVDPAGSWAVLEALDKWDVPPPAALARRRMRAIREGTYKPQ